MGVERPGIGAPVDLLEDRCLHFMESFGEQGFPDRAEDVAARTDEVAGSRVDGEIDVAGTDSRLGIGEAFSLVRQGPQALAEQPPLSHQHRRGPVLAVAHQATGLDQVAEVDVGEIRCRPVKFGFVQE